MEIIFGLPEDKFELFLFVKSSESHYMNVIRHKLKGIYDLNRLKFRLSDIIELNKYINRISPDFVFSLSKTTSHYALILKTLLQYDFVLINASIRNAPIKMNNYLKIEKVLYNFYKNVVANSYAGLAAYKQLGKKGRYVLHNGFNMNRVSTTPKDELRQELGLDDKFTVIMVASMGDSKDQKTFIRSAYQVLKTDGYIQFYLIGDGPRKSEHEILVESFGIKKNVSFLGEVDNVELYFGAADLSVLTSASWHGEGIPNVVLESLACGTPVIATDNGGTKEILDHGFNGYLIKNGDYETLAEKILFLKNNPIRLKSFAQNCLSIIEDRFRTENMIMNFEKIILTE